MHPEGVKRLKEWKWENSFGQVKSRRLCFLKVMHSVTVYSRPKRIRFLAFNLVTTQEPRGTKKNIYGIISWVKNQRHRLPSIIQIEEWQISMCFWKRARQPTCQTCYKMSKVSSVLILLRGLIISPIQILHTDLNHKTTTSALEIVLFQEA